MKQYIPQSLKLNYRLSSRFARDVFKGHARRFARPGRRQITYNGMVEVRQAIKQHSHSDNKIHNIRLASEKIGQVHVLPGHIFSFWKTVGRPLAKKGYKPGRALLGGKLQEDVGGGLCQLAGIIYHGSLKAGMEIMERHPHSLDIYEEHERYTPLGADAAVAYGYKDLRLRNPHPFAIKYSFILSNGELSCRVFMEDKIFPYRVEFLREAADGDAEQVRTIITDLDGNSKEVSVSAYKKEVQSVEKEEG